MTFDNFIGFASAAELYIRQLRLSAIEIISSFFCFILNIYCLVAIATVKKLQSLDFFLIILQTVVDCFFVGFVGCLLKMLEFGEKVKLIKEQVDYSEAFPEFSAEINAPDFVFWFYDNLHFIIKMDARLSYICRQIYLGFLYATPFIVLSMTFERYIIVVHAAKAKEILSERNKILFYLSVTFLTVLAPIFRLADLLIVEKNMTTNAATVCFGNSKKSLNPF
ncbi:uncharacterized protein LOC142339746 [Convolutriloba macropyga]|uniref:uncharacterized protein LOC142339746 n=1 Tax=Convolutriloba macropyga TaxID=536237 RepID=UPI003F51D414